MFYRKLVRDRIPDIIREKGQVPLVHIASEAEYWQKLKERLSEEVDEYIVNEEEDEIIDILEVIDAICYFRKLDTEDMGRRRKAKQEERGRFLKRIILDEVK